MSSTREVIIQRLTTSGSFKNFVFEVLLEPFNELNGPWFVLQKIKYLREASSIGEIPFLHKGFFDSHLHLSWIGEMEQQLSLKNCSSKEDLLFVLKAGLDSTPPTQVLHAFGWDESKFNLSLNDFLIWIENKLPQHRSFLLQRICGHAALVSQHLREQYPTKSYSFYLSENDLFDLFQVLPKPSHEQIKKNILVGQKNLLSVGVSAISDMSLDDQTVAALVDLQEQGLLQLDIIGVIDAPPRGIKNYERGPLILKSTRAVRPMNRLSSLSLRHWKKFLDGSFGSQTAWLKEPYFDDESNYGMSTQADLIHLLNEARGALQKGLALSFHCIGDAALDQALQIGEELMEEMKKINGHRLEHVQLIRDDQIKKIIKQNLWTLHLQPGHRISDKSFIQKRLDQQRLWSQAYRLGSLYRAGISLSLGSDGPIDVFNPSHIFQAALHHENHSERLNFDEIIWLYTTGGRLNNALYPGVIDLRSVVCLTPCEF